MRTARAMSTVVRAEEELLGEDYLSLQMSVRLNRVSFHFFSGRRWTISAARARKLANWLVKAADEIDERERK